LGGEGQPRFVDARPPSLLLVYSASEHRHRRTQRHEGLQLQPSPQPRLSTLASAQGHDAFSQGQLSRFELSISSLLSRGRLQCLPSEE